MDDIIRELKEQNERIVVYLREELKTIRTGRATPALLEGLVVDAYQGQAKLKLPEIASITTEGPLTLVVAPFDPSIVGDIEKAILTSALGLSPQTQGTRILIHIPMLSEEQREKFIKLVGQKVEEKRNSLRSNREEARKRIKVKFEASQITEDDRFRKDKEIDDITQKYTEDIQVLKTRKEEEIRKI